MKGLMLVIIIGLSGVLHADQRMETVGGFCHFVINPDNEDNEIFVSNCVSSIVQNNNRTGTGWVLKKVKYPGILLPVSNLMLTGAETGINCVMVDSNGTTYVTQDWISRYVPSKLDVTRMAEFAKASRSYNEEYDYDNNGVVDSLDAKWFKLKKPRSITYELTCKNGSQQ